MQPNDESKSDGIDDGDEARFARTPGRRFSRRLRSAVDQLEEALNATPRRRSPGPLECRRISRFYGVTGASRANDLQRMSITTTSPSLLCPHCDLLLAASTLQADESAHCPRCRVELDAAMRVSKVTVLAIAASAVPLWCVMNAFPLVTLTLGGERCDSTLFGAAVALSNSGMPGLAALVVATAIVAPAAEILLALHILVNVSRSTRLHGLGRTVRWLKRIKHWSMADVFLLGCLVSVVKLSHVAHLVVGPALWACGLLLPALAFVTVHVQPRRLFGSMP